MEAESNGSLVNSVDSAALPISAVDQDTTKEASESDLQVTPFPESCKDLLERASNLGHGDGQTQETEVNSETTVNPLADEEVETLGGKESHICDASEQEDQVKETDNLGKVLLGGTNDVPAELEQIDKLQGDLNPSSSEPTHPQDEVVTVGQETEQVVNLEAVSIDKPEACQATGNDSTDTQSPDGASLLAQVGQAGEESHDHTNIPTSLPIGPSGNHSLQTPEEANVYAEIRSPDGKVSIAKPPEDQPESSIAGNNNYTDIQSPEAKSSPTGPSDDREDISDAELDLTSENVQATAETPHGASMECISKREAQEPGEAMDLKSESKDASLDDLGREIVEVKPDDTVKSDAGSIADDASRVSKGPSEDLEAVSDDELPESSHLKSVVPSSKAVVEGGEDVSSEDEENIVTANTGPGTVEAQSDSMATVNQKVSLPPSEREPVSPTALPEPVSPTDLAEPVSPTSLAEPVSPTDLAEPVSPTALAEPVSPTALAEPVSPTALADPVSPNGLAELAPLDAEPISDEEDNSGLAEDEDGEAGEIKSPTEDITSPPSSPGHGAANLGEVEPVSADDSTDTDGELPSGDEDSGKPGEDQPKSGVNFESIESEEEGDLNVSASSNVLARDNKSASKENADGYMESISDEENMENSTDKLINESIKDAVIPLDSSGEIKSFISRSAKDGESGRKVPAPNFNEHQVELDYEEAEGDDGEMKPDDARLGLQIKEDGEVEKQDDAASDKDEGELSDDDCEEGEIKEPGSRKPFVKPMCRFFQRGNCTWGVNCRFLHPGVNDKGNYQMIEIPGFQPTGVHARLGAPGPWQEQQPPAEQMELPPPPLPDTPPPETAWERGLRIAKEQRKKATERKEQEPDFEEKRLNLSVDEERELNKENERVPRIIPKDPYYDQQAFEEDEYYKISRDPWQTGHYENFEVRYNREPSYSPPPYREKPPMPPAMRYNRPYNSPPPVDKFGRDRIERREEYRPKPAPPAPVANEYPSPPRRPDEWVDPWRRQTTRKSSKSPARGKHKRSRSRGRRGRRSVSDSSNSSRSVSGSSTGSSRSSRSYSGSSGSSSRSRSPEPAPPGVDRHDRHQSPSNRDQPRSAVSVRGRGGGYPNNYNDSGYRRDQQGYGRSRGGGGGRGDGGYQNRTAGGRGGGGPGGPYNTGWGGPSRGGDGYPNRDNNRDMMRDRGRDDRMGRPRVHSPPDRPLPYVRPRPRSASSRSSSSGSRSRSRSRSRAGREAGRGHGSSSRSSSGSSSSRSSSSSSVGSADSEHLYRDLGSPGKSPAQGGAAPAKKKRVGSSGHKDRGGASGRGPPPGSLPPSMPGSQRHPGMPPPPSGSQQQRHHVNLDHIPIPRDSRDPRDAREGRGMREGRDPRDMRDPRDARDARIPREPGMAGPGRSESRYASRNAPQAPVKAKDPLKVVGQKSNIKLTLLPKQQQSSLGSRPNPLDSPPRKRRISDRDPSPPSAPPAKRLNLPVPQTSALRLATEKAAKIHMRQDKVRPSPPPSSSLSSSQHHSSMTGGGSSGMPPTSSSSSRARAPISPQKQSSSGLKSRGPEPSVAKTAPKLPAGSSAGGGSASMAGVALAASAPGAGPSGGGAKAKKSMSSRREELLKQLKAVEDAIARKKTKLT